MTSWGAGYDKWIEMLVNIYIDHQYRVNYASPGNAIFSGTVELFVDYTHIVFMWLSNAMRRHTLGQQLIWWHQANTCSNVDLSSMGSCGTHLKSMT